MNTTPDPVAFPYDELVRILGTDVPRNAWTEATGPLDLTGHWLFAPCHPWVVERLRALPGCEEDWTTAVVDGLAALFGSVFTAHLCATGREAVAGAVNAARTVLGRKEVVWVGTDPPDGVPVSEANAARQAIEMRGDVVAALVMSPLLDESTALALARAARAAGARILVDERLTACRLAGSGSPLVSLLDPDAVIAGESLACGMPFGAVLEREASGIDAAPPGSASIAYAAATIGALRDEPAYDRLVAAGEAIRNVFAARCHREEVNATLAGPAGAMHISFAGQENAAPDQMLDHFGRELEAQGVRAGEVVFPMVPRGEDDDGAPAFDAAVERIRTLLVEYNSYLSGGLPYPFGGNESRLVERGLTMYRYPSHAATSITTADDRVRVSFAPEVCKLVSSGFYVPTRVRGDFTVNVDYEIRRWQPGEDCANFALFVQNETSSARYYAQRRSSAADPEHHEAFYVACGHESTARATETAHGSLRLQRAGCALSAWHREMNGGWELLGTDEQATTEDIYVGAKIWSLVKNDGLEVDFRALSIEGEIPDDQSPVLHARPDPRGADGGE